MAEENQEAKEQPTPESGESIEALEKEIDGLEENFEASEESVILLALIVSALQNPEKPFLQAVTAVLEEHGASDFLEDAQVFADAEGVEVSDEEAAELLNLMTEE